MPPLAQPIGGILAGQARAPRAVRAALGRGLRRDARLPVGHATARRRYELSPEARGASPASRPRPETIDLDELRRVGVAASEEDLLLVALFGEDAERLLATLRGRADRDERRRTAALDRGEAARIRELIHMVEDVRRRRADDRGLHGVKITVRRQDDRRRPRCRCPSQRRPGGRAGRRAPAGIGVDGDQDRVADGRHVLPLAVARRPTRSWPRATGWRSGQTLCVLEAMKLFNEFKSEHAGVIRRILVENAEPVEFGQPLFELEPA